MSTKLPPLLVGHRQPRPVCGEWTTLMQSVGFKDVNYWFGPEFLKTSPVHPRLNSNRIRHSTRPLSRMPLIWNCDLNRPLNELCMVLSSNWDVHAKERWALILQRPNRWIFWRCRWCPTRTDLGPGASTSKRQKWYFIWISAHSVLFQLTGLWISSSLNFQKNLKRLFL